MSGSLLTQRLAPVVSRLRQLRLLQGMTRGWFAGAAIVAVLHFLVPDLSVLWLVLAGVATASALFIPSRSSDGDLQVTAVKEVEQNFPELDSRLFTALSMPPRERAGEYGFLESQVLFGVLEHARQHRWKEVVSGKRLAAAHLLQGGGCLVFMTLVYSLISAAVDNGLATVDPAANSNPVLVTQQGGELLVEPGDVEIERGTSLLVTASFTGAVPAEVTLVTTDATGASLETPLVRALDDPVFGGRLTEINGDMQYQLRYGSELSTLYSITTYELPRLVRLDAEILPPKYTELLPSVEQDVRVISVIEGSAVTLTATLNKPVRSAILQPRGKRANDLPSISLEPSQSTSGTLVARFAPTKSVTYELELVDAAGRTDPEPSQFTVEVVRNLPPKLAIKFPRRDVRVSPLEEVVLEADASDDFGLNEYGLVYVTPAGETQRLKLGPPPATTAPSSAQSLPVPTLTATTKQARGIGTVLTMETLEVVPDDLLTYYFYASDIGPDGAPRETFSDLFFAEVRPFDETYRQAPDTPPAEGEGQESQKLLTLQRQIVSALWNLIRRENLETSSSAMADDVSTVALSQAEVITILDEQLLEITDPQLRQHAEAARVLMQQTEQQLNEKLSLPADTNPLLSGTTVPTLTDARNSAQGAYQALLKMQAREHLVKKQQQGKGKSKPRDPEMNRQLQELELKNDRSRYETESQAKQQQQQAQQDTLQVLNRLKELARRQEDLNERIRQAEAAARDAQTPSEQQAAQQQLQRLQEEQQNLLRDLDETRERMNRESVREDLADSREQLDQTRERVFRSAEALKQGQTSQALAEGNRAQQELEQLQDEVRKQTAGQFDVRVQELAREIAEIAKAEVQIAQQLQKPNVPATPEESTKPSLRPTTPPDRNGVADQLANQERRLGEAMQQMQKLVLDAETAEPLLSRKLYDAIRDARVDQPQEALAAASQLMRRGIEQPAIDAEAQARRGIDKLQAGVQKAAESVLGDQQAATRRARDQLAQLSNAVKRELQDRTGTGDEPQPAGENGTKQPMGSGQPIGPGEPMEQGPPMNGSPMPGGAPMTGESSMAGESPSTGESPASGESPMGQSPGGQSPMGQSPGGMGEGGEPSASGPPSLRPGQGQGKQPGQGQNPMPGSPNGRSTGRNAGGQNAEGGSVIDSPLTGDEFVAWSDQLRDVEEMIADPVLRAELAQVRDRAREMRIEFKRHSKEPNWELVRTRIFDPLRELEQRLSDDLARQNEAGELVPIDRDPVPDRYKELVRRYYEELSRERPQSATR